MFPSCCQMGSALIPTNYTTHYPDFLKQLLVKDDTDNAQGYGKPARELLYGEIPDHFYWTSAKEWLPRRRPSDTIGRLYFATPVDGERYYLRLLLLNVRGPTSFDDLRTFEGITHKNFREASVRLDVRARFTKHVLHAVNFQPTEQSEQVVEHVPGRTRKRLWLPSPN
ncbi:hypothetical protein PtA15_12A514 [Puccinia triticina]|uniref:Uncharacterized protein n=1 Tax=Puccinia triticina TaxID=208348 RepID=A0ABY7CYW9_9BASI|nr:uncharacterized protein PtA15_12A514 [Puccinia triticina]WAQ90524.1 hypothetical protein PtA15_12A514 [Puccinia triticina]